MFCNIMKDLIEKLLDQYYDTDVSKVPMIDYLAPPPTEISPPSPPPEHVHTPPITILSEPPKPSPIKRATSVHPS